MRDPISTSLDVVARHGPAVSLDLGGSRAIHHIAGRRMVEPVFRDTAAFTASGVTLSGPRGSAQRRLRHGIVRANGAEHAHYRKLLLPFFRRSTAERARRRMAEIAVEELDRLPLSGAVDFRAWSGRLARRLSALVLFGEDARPVLSIGSLVERHVELGFHPLSWIAPLPMPFTPYRRLLDCADEIEAAILDWTRELRGADPTSSAISALVNAPDENGRPLSEERLVGHVMNLLAAAYETTAGTLAGVCYCLAQSPALAATLAGEFAAANREESVERAFASATLDRLIWESTRLVTPVPYQRRTVRENRTIGGLAFRPRDIVIIGAFATNRDPGVYAEPDAFRPERWPASGPNPFEWLVFSAGPRHCLGYWLALVMLKVAVWSVLTNRRLRLTEGARIDLRAAITTRMVGGLPLEMPAAHGPFRRAEIKGRLARLTRFPGPAAAEAPATRA